MAVAAVKLFLCCEIPVDYIDLKHSQATGELKKGGAISFHPHNKTHTFNVLARLHFYHAHMPMLPTSKLNASRA